MSLTRNLLLASTLLLFGCDDGGGGTPPIDASTSDGASGDPDGPEADAAVVDCEGNTYDNFAAGFMTSYCLTCHSINSTNRRGAPASVNFDTYEQVMTRSNRIRLRAGLGTTMPPSSSPTGDPSADERAKMVTWIECGMPEN